MRFFSTRKIEPRQSGNADRETRDLQFGSQIVSTPRASVAAATTGTPLQIAGTSRSHRTANADSYIDGMELTGWYPSQARQGIFRGLDLNALADRFVRLDAMRYEGPRIAIRWRACSYAMQSVSYGPTRGIIVSLWERLSLEDAAETLLHEIVHVACPRGQSHGELFRRRLIACAREAFGLELDTAALLALPASAGRCRAYAIDTAIVKAMVAADVGAKLRCGFAFVAPPPVSDDDLAQRRAEALAERRSKRLAHADAMHRLAVTRLRRAQTIEKKWRRKLAVAARTTTPAPPSEGGGDE